VFCVVDNHSQHGLSEPENIICTNVVVACFFVQKPILVKLSKGDGFLLSFDELILWHRVRRRNFLKYDFSGAFPGENIGKICDLSSLIPGVTALIARRHVNIIEVQKTQQKSDRVIVVADRKRLVRIRFPVNGTDVFVSVFRSHIEPRIAAVFGRFEHLHDIYLSAVKYVSDKAMLVPRKTYAFIDSEPIRGTTSAFCDDLCSHKVRIVA